MRRFKKWAYGLVGGIIGGAASAVFSEMGMTAAHGAGVDVPVLNLKALGVIGLSSIITHAAAYLMKSPLPPIDDGTTTFTKKDTTDI